MNAPLKIFYSELPFLTYSISIIKLFDNFTSYQSCYGIVGIYYGVIKNNIEKLSLNINLNIKLQFAYVDYFICMQNMMISAYKMGLLE